TAHVEIEAAAVAQEDVAAPPPRHHTPEQVARYLIRRQSPLPAEATGEAVLSLDPEYPPVHVPNLRSRGRRVLSRRTGAPYCGSVPSGPRLRQVALVARDCGQVAGELRRAFGWPPPFHDPGVGQFGLT